MRRENESPTSFPATFNLYCLQTTDHPREICYDGVNGRNERRYRMSDRGELVNKLNEVITELHRLIRKDHEHMDVLLHREINKYASEEILGKIIADFQEKIHNRNK